MGSFVNKIFEVKYDESCNQFYARLTNVNGIFLFRWRLFHDAETFETFDVPVGVIETFDTFISLCGHFDTPDDANKWYRAKIRGRNVRK